MFYYSDKTIDSKGGDMEANTNNQQIQYVQVTPHAVAAPANAQKVERIFSNAQKDVFKWAAVISYIVGFIYVKYGIENSGIVSGFPYLGRLIFAIVFVACTEVFAYKIGVTYESLKEKKKSFIEPAIYAMCIVLQSLAYTLWGTHEDWAFYQFVLWHFSFVYYVLARTGTLAAGRSGLMFIIDSFQGFITVPFSNLFLRINAIFKKGEMDDELYESEHPAKKINKATVITIIVSLVIAAIVCLYAVAELTSASETFAVLGDKFFNYLDYFLKQKFWDYIWENFVMLIVSIPVGAYLFGLVGGSLFRDKPYYRIKDFEEDTRSYHLLPSYSAYIVIGSVCFVYALFLGASINDFIAHKGLFAESAPEACQRALSSFWSLIRVVLMNFAVIACSCIFSKKALWEEKGTRILATVLFIFALGFAIMAAFNLMGVYVGYYGWTPRRILSSWVVMNVIAWCILLIIRFYKKIPAAQIGIILAAVSFSVIDMFKF